jgi:hypothetical protein
MLFYVFVQQYGAWDDTVTPAACFGVVELCGYLDSFAEMSSVSGVVVFPELPPLPGSGGAHPRPGQTRSAPGASG